MQNKYPNHPLLPLMQLLESIDSADEFKARQVEIFEAIHLAAPILRDRTPELRSLANQPFFKRQGSPSTPFRMARFVESRIKETLDLARPKTAKPKTLNLGSLDSSSSASSSLWLLTLEFIPLISCSGDAKTLDELSSAAANIRSLEVGML